MTQLTLIRDSSGLNTFGLNTSTQKKNVALTSDGGERTTTAPTDNLKGYLVVFSFEPGSRVWFATGSAAIQMPMVDTVSDTNAELNPTSRTVAQGATLRFQTNDTSAEVGFAFYALS